MIQSFLFEQFPELIQRNPAILVRIQFVHQSLGLGLVQLASPQHAQLSHGDISRVVLVHRLNTAGIRNILSSPNTGNTAKDSPHTSNALPKVKLTKYLLGPNVIIIVFDLAGFSRRYMSRQSGTHLLIVFSAPHTVSRYY